MEHDGGPGAGLMSSLFTIIIKTREHPRQQGVETGAVARSVSEAPRESRTINKVAPANFTSFCIKLSTSELAPNLIKY